MLAVLAAALSLSVIDPKATVADLCRPGYSAAHRAVSAKTKAALYRAANVSPPYRGHWVVDHICPLELGCRNVKANLQVQSYADSKAKDRLENANKRAMCAGRLTLDQARAPFLKLDH